MRRVPTLPDGEPASRAQPRSLCNLRVVDREPLWPLYDCSNEMNRTLIFLRRERLKREDVDVLIGEYLAQLSKRSRRRILPAPGVGAAGDSMQAHRLSVDDKSDNRTFEVMLHVSG